MNVSEDLINLFKTLGESTRLNILNFLQEDEKSAQEIQKALNKSQSIISQRLKNLIDADILVVQRKKHQKYYRIKYPKILEIISATEDIISRNLIKKLKEFRIVF
ncbi:hypothetical protein LCGC14_1475120 [marine sediment metagenome]|uniref:HTH arsR-type domain-containing protein n=1 Tax=marine sediment metagenome TaxID=412755 RepID=A0A0F9JB62_9ZZZZ|nr:ArsR family transcriptional regulator [archaeon]HEC41042.1 ArsR family transcriptional regulator [bacterium]